MARLNKFFEYLEDLILSIIAVMTIGAVGFELYAVYERGSIELADLLSVSYTHLTLPTNSLV